MPKIYNQKEECCGCGACVNVCPQGCITMEQDMEGFGYPNVDEKRCTNCGQCDNVCPFKVDENQSEIIKSFACFSYSENERMKSSSGAIFSLLAHKIIEENGIIFGTAMTQDNMMASIISAENIASLEPLLGSKYLQSNSGIIYKKVKEELLNGRKVLFTGTPCQINGLKKFLKIEYDNLLCVDIICHGVPSPELWKRYVKSIEKKNCGKIMYVDFRCKDSNWHKYGIKENRNGKWTFKSKNDDPFMQMFLKNYCLRPSCYNCKVKNNRLADITIGDFWGIEEIMPDMNDGKGTSLVIFRTKKGLNKFDEIKERCKWEECSYEIAVKRNIAELYSVTLPLQRNFFFNDMNQLTFNKLADKYLGCAFKRKMKNILKKILKGRKDTILVANGEYGLLIYLNTKSERIT